MDQIVKFFLLFAIIIMIIFLYFSIIPCNNTSVEQFDLPIELSDVIQDRTNALKQQVMKSNILGQNISHILDDIKSLKHKVKILSDSSNNLLKKNKTYIINTNGELTEEV